MKHVKVGACCLFGLYLAVFGIGAAGSAAAASLLFIPHSGQFPYHMVGSMGPTRLVTVSGTTIEASKTEILALVLNKSLVHWKLEFLKVKESFGGSCKNDGKIEAVLTNMVSHFGFTSILSKIGVLLLTLAGFEFECLGAIGKVKVRGAVVGEITSPALNTAAELIRLVVKQTSGKQEFTGFLLGEETLTNQFLESSLSGGEFEQSGLEGEVHLLALKGQGTFLLVSP